MELNKEQQSMLSGKEGRGAQKAMEMIIAVAEAQGAEKLVPIDYAHLMPPDLMFMPFGKQGKWAKDMTEELTRDVARFRVPVVTVEPKFCDLCVAKDLQYTDGVIEEIKQIQGNAESFYENLGVVNTYTAMPFLFYQTKMGQHVSISESIATLWFNTMFGSRCERDDGVKSLAAAITGYVPYEGAHLPENRYAEVIIRPGSDLNFEAFTDADWDAYSLAASRKCREKRPVFTDVPKDIGFTDLKHLLAVIAVESGLAVMHIVGVTPEADTLEAALAGHKPEAEFTLTMKEMDEAYSLANTTDSKDIDFILMGCPHITMKEFRDLAEVLEGKRVHSNVKLIVSTQRLLLEQAQDMGFVDAIRNAGGIVTSDMCIAFAGTQVQGTVATNSIKAVFFYAGFDAEGTRGVRFGSTKDCARAALTGKWEGRV